MAGDKGVFQGGFEREEGVPGPELYSAPFETESFMAEPTYEPDPNLDPSGNETEGEILKADGNGKVTAAANSESWLFARAHHHGYYAVTTPAAGVRLWEFRDRDELNEAPIAHYLDSLHARIYRDENTNPTVHGIFGWKVQEFTARADANKYLFFDHEGPFLRDRYVKKPDELVADPGWTGHLEVDGHRAGGDENGNPYNFKVTQAGALDGSAPVPQIQFGKNDVYAGDSYDVVPNEWIFVREADGTTAGNPKMPLRIRFIADADTDALALNQEWKILATAPKPVPIFTARPKLSAPSCEVRFSRNSGVSWFTKRIEGGFSLKMGRPREALFGLTSLHALTIDKPNESRKWWELSWNGTYEDLGWKQGQLAGTIFSVYARFDGALIGSTGLRDYSEFTLENMRVTQAGATIQNPGRLPENPTLRAFSEGASLCVEKHQNTVLTLVPVEDVS